MDYAYGFPDFTRDKPTHIFDNIFISGVDFTDNLPLWCEKNGFQAIISFAADQKHYNVENINIPIKIFKIKDREGENIIEHLESAKRFYDKIKGKVLVHCMWGMSRSATCVIYLLMMKYNYSFPKAFMFVKNKRPIIQPNSGFLKQLNSF